MIDRKEYIEMCQKCAVLPRGVFGVALNVPDVLKVVHGGIAYYPKAYYLDFDEHGTPEHFAVIHDLNQHGVIYAPLENIKRFSDDEEASI